MPIFKSQFPDDVQIPIFKIQNKKRLGFGAVFSFFPALIIGICLAFGD